MPITIRQTSNTTLDDASPLITYHGDWGTNHKDDPWTPKYSDGTFHSSTNDGMWARVLWTGKDITVFGAKRNNHGHYSIILDDGQVQFFDGFSEKEQIQAVLFASSGLQQGEHELLLINSNNYQSQPGKVWLDLDHVNFVGTPLGPDDYCGPDDSPGATTPVTGTAPVSTSTVVESTSAVPPTTIPSTTPATTLSTAPPSTKVNLVTTSMSPLNANPVAQSMATVAQPPSTTTKTAGGSLTSDIGLLHLTPLVIVAAKLLKLI